MASKAVPAFDGFSPAAHKFLRDLATNNDRAWFEPRKDAFKRELQEPLAALSVALSDALAKAKLPIAADPRRTAFRIYRDVRFSRDKSPYKTNLGIYLPHEGRRDAPGGLYLHIQPNQNFIAAGFYGLERPALHDWRTAIAADPKRFAKLLAALKKNGLDLDGHGEALKRMPRGFEGHAESAHAKFFRVESYIVSEPVSDEHVRSREIVAYAVDFTKRAKPLLEYGWSLS